MTKKIALFTILAAAISFCFAAENSQTLLYNAICEKNYDTAIHAVEDLGADATFLMPLENSRTVKQVNALNFALETFETNGRQELLQVILKRVEPDELDSLLDYEDQLTHKTPRELANELFPSRDVCDWLGNYMKRSHFSADVDELLWQRTQCL